MAGVRYFNIAPANSFSKLSLLRFCESWHSFILGALLERLLLFLQFALDVAGFVTDGVLGSSWWLGLKLVLPTILRYYQLSGM